MREGKVMTTGSEGRSSADVALHWKKLMKTVGSASYVIEQSFVSINCKLINFKGCVTQAAF